MFEAVAAPAGSRNAGGRCKQREHLPELRSSGGALNRSLHGRKVQVHKLQPIAEGF
jgi:hypothetical protein